MRVHLDMNLPIVDVGCGNGRFTRRLSGSFPAAAWGVDLSDNAVALANREAAGVPNLTFRVLDGTAPDAANTLRAELGTDANVFVRGVFHVLDEPGRRTALARTLLQGSQLGYLEHLGATPRNIPAPLQRAIEDLPMPGHFGQPERAASFPGAEWDVILDGPTPIQTIPLRATAQPELIPGYFAIMAGRNTGPPDPP